MRIVIELMSKDKVVLPVGFNRYIQALIYNLIDMADSNWLHNTGYKMENKSFKLFTFSSILEMGRYIKEERLFIFPNKISFTVSSPVDWILEEVAKNTITNDSLQLGNNYLSVLSINVLKQPVFKSNKIKIRAVTPIEVHSTFQKSNGKKITHYYTPFEDEFNSMINFNLRDKRKALFNDNFESDITIKPLFKGNNYERIVYFGTGENKTIVKGWKGYFELNGDIKLLDFAYNTGLGSRNSQGFGMIEVVE